MKQRTEEWYQARLGCLGASSIADMLATTKSGESASRANLRARIVAERLTGRPQETYTNAAMQHGIDTEAEARAMYEVAVGVMVAETGWHKHPRIDWCGASPDGLIEDCGLLEIKCPNTATHIDTLLSKRVPAKYLPQMQWQMAVTGRQWVDFVSYDPRMPPDLQLWTVRVARDDARIEQLEVEAEKFLAEVADVVSRLRGTHTDQPERDGFQVLWMGEAAQEAAA